MAELQFPDVGNALRAGFDAAYTLGRGRRENEAEARRQEAQGYYGAAAKGDPAAMAKVASGDPQGATALATMLGRIDATQAAKVKAAAEYSARAANAVLQADPADRPAIYKAAIDEGRRNGYQISLPDIYSPAVDGQLRAHRAQAIDINKWYEEDAKTKREQGNMPVPLGGGPPAAAAPAPDRAKFVQTMMPHALAVAQATGLDPRLVLAQTILETGDGASAPGNNYFGIKSHGAPGGQVLPTKEAGPGGALVPTQDSFRTYADPGASAADYANFLKTNSRYAPVLQAKGLDAQIEAMGRSGYATDPNYAAKLRQIANSLPPAQMPSPPPGLVPNATMAQMPGAPQGLIPPGPPPAQMPQVAIPSTASRSASSLSGQLPPFEYPGAVGVPLPALPQRGLPMPQMPAPVPPAAQMPQLAQGDQIGPGGVRTAPEAQLSPEAKTIREIVRATRPGWQVMVMPKTRLPIYDGQGRLYVRGPNGEEDYMEIAKPPGPKDNPQAVAGPFSNTSIQGTALNMAIADGVITRRQASDLALGKVIKLDDGTTLYFTPQGLLAAGQAGGGPVSPVGAPATPMPTAPAPPPAAPSGAAVIGGPKPQTPNNEQARDQGFADRMIDAEKYLSAVDVQGKSETGRLQEKIPFGVGNYLQSKEYQSFKQARDNFINAQLRRESGAVISADEYRKADQQYFPIPGDLPETVAQKAENRKSALEAMIRSGGPSYKPPARTPAPVPRTGDRPPLSSFER